MIISMLAKIASAQAGIELGFVLVAILAVVSALVGANYGANLALFPSVTKDYYGLKNFGVNYGLLYTSWGVGGFMLALLAGKVYDETGSFGFAYYCSAALLALAAVATSLISPPGPVEEKHARNPDQW